MSTKFAWRIVTEESPIAMTEALIKAMRERTSAILEGYKTEISPYILFENQDYDVKLDNAIDYVINEVNESGINSLVESIDKAAPIFKINRADLKAVFESAINDEDERPLMIEEIDLNQFQSSFLSKLDNILEDNSGNILGFLDTTSAYITPQEGKALVEVYSNLNAENKKKLVEKLVSSKREFNKVLNFALSTLNEDI